MKKLLPIILSILFLAPFIGYAAWSATENFDSYSNGNTTATPLSGGTGWSGNWTTVNNDNFTITNAQAYSSPNSISSAQGGALQRTIKRTLTTALTGTTNEMQIAVRVSSIAATSGRGIIPVYAGATFRFQIEFGYNGGALNIKQATSGGNDVALASISADTWYLVTIDMDITNNRVRTKVDSGSYTAYRTMDGSGNIDTIQLENQDGTTGTTYWDSIAGPTVAGAAPSLSNFFWFWE